jgi:hypothetical protein
MDALALVDMSADDANEKKEDAERQPNRAAQGVTQHGRGKQTCTANDRAQNLH